MKEMNCKMRRVYLTRRQINTVTFTSCVCLMFLFWLWLYGVLVLFDQESYAYVEGERDKPQEFEYDFEYNLSSNNKVRESEIRNLERILEKNASGGNSESASTKETPKECFKSSLPNDDFLATVSVVITFESAEEALANLPRTLSSIFRTTSSHLLQEIVVVDDASDCNGCVSLFGSMPKVVLFSVRKPLGPVRALIAGVSITTGDTIFVTQAGAEFSDGWAVSMLRAIQLDPFMIACPTVANLNSRTLPTQETFHNYKGGFDWNFNFRWLQFDAADLMERREDPTSAIRSPIIPGNSYLFSRELWNEFGEADADLDLLNIHRIELSLRCWQCGGSIRIFPCSLIWIPMHERSEVERKNMREDLHEDGEDIRLVQAFLRNAKRVATVWMDDFSSHFVHAWPIAAYLNHGNVDVRLSIRRDLQCLPFSWYLSRVFYDLNVSSGRIKAKGHLMLSTKCLLTSQSVHSTTPFLLDCNSAFNREGKWSLIDNGQLRHGKKCLAADQVVKKSPSLKGCFADYQQRWHRSSLLLIHGSSGLCLEASQIGFLSLAACSMNQNQQWIFSSEIDPADNG